MKIGIPKERREGEARAAATPDSVKKFISLGAEVAIESGAGAGASISDEAYAAAGAKIVPDAAGAVADADVIELEVLHAAETPVDIGAGDAQVGAEVRDR